MSNYTKTDPDVMFLDTDDRVAYEFDLLKFNVEKNVEASYGYQGLMNPRGIKEKFKDPKKIGLAIITLLCFIIAIVLLLLILIYIVLVINQTDWKLELLRKVVYSLALIFVILIVFYMIYNLMYGEMIVLVNMTKNNAKPNESD